MKQLTLFFCILTLAGCASAPPRPTGIARGDYASSRAYIAKLIRHEMSRNSVEGLSIALVDDQRIVWAEGFGYADEEKNLPATADTVYRVGSISKLFTDTAAMQLVEQGWFDIDQPLRHYVPGFSIRTRFAGAPEITPRHLMTHHSGLPRDRQKGFMTANPPPFAQLVDELRDSDAAYPPNLVFSYSNLGISLLGVAIQKQGGLPFDEFMRRSLLVPLGMSNSSFDTGLSSSALAARGYRGRQAVVEPALRDVPAGGLNSSVADLSRFISMVFASGKSGNRQIVQAKTLAEMLRPQNAAVPLDFNFHAGLGWMLSTLGTSSIRNGGTVAHHSGATAYFHSQMYILPEYKLGVVVLSNSSTSGRAVDHIATEALTLALEAKTGIRQPEPFKMQPDARPLPSETVQEYAGDYTTLAGFARIRTCGRGLCADVADHGFDLVRGSDGLFRLDYSLLGIFRVDLGPLGEIGLSRRTVEGRELLVARVGEQEMLVGERIQPVSTPQAWRQYLGDYEIADLEGDHKFVERISLIEERGYLLVEVTPVESYGIKQRIALKPLSDSEGILLGPLGDGGETVRSVTLDGKKRVQFSGYLLKKLSNSGNL
ncbi:MAG: beta-lactamase family protein [Nitrosomonadales bacterium]|nr:beta-lactamase family protein [Nitrosomonadales bacterium]